MLAPGNRLGAYEIVAAIGAGGMGEVYRARDTRLKREVAFKILPESLASDPDRLARFQREAEVLASLNHPNIAAIHGLEEADGIRALVMELVEGETLADRLARGPVPLDEALPIAKQIAEALEAAHEQGIVHRDLKPANIKLRPDGTVKVLDFGLAKALEPASTANRDASLSPTITSPAMMTGIGVLLGTVAYMAPEQAKGRIADKRADVWAFGCVLYEMLTGRRAFGGEDVAETVAAVIRSEPDFATVPVAARRLIKACLEKDPKKRLRDLGDVWRLLDWPEESRPETQPRRKRLPWVATAVVAIVVAGGSALYFRSVPREKTVVRTTILSPDQTIFNVDGNDSGPAAISPDGTRIVFSAQSADGKNQLWVRTLETLTARALPGTDGATYPFWSPDGLRVGFFADLKLKRVDLVGGPPFTVCDLPNPQGGGSLLGRGGTWNDEGIILFAGSNSPIFSVAAAGGAPTAITSLDPAKGITTHRWPSFLPDRRHFLYVAGSNQSLALPGTSIRIGSLDAREDSSVVFESGSNEQVLSQAVFASGYLLFSRQNTLMAQPFDATRLRTTADPIRIADEVGAVTVIGHSNFSASKNGMLIYQSGTTAAGLGLTWLDRRGARLSTLGDPGNLGSIKLSPDEKTVAVTVATAAGRSDIWLYDVARRLRTRFTFDAADDKDPIWSPDGRSIIFSSNRKGHFDLYRRASNLTGDDELLYADGLDKRPTSWSRNGKYLLYMVTDPNTRSDVWAVPLTGERKPFRPFVQTPFDENFGQFSPDGRWIAYSSTESQNQEIYIVPFAGTADGQGGKRQVSTGGGRFPRWRSDGKEIFFFTIDRRLMAADVIEKDGILDIGAVRELFGGLTYAGTIEYDPSLDGQRFIALTAPEQKTPASLTLVQNWTADLQR